MDPRIRQRLMGQGQGVDAVPDNLFSQATAAAQAVPQDQQLEAQDETPDTTTDDTTPPAVPPAPDTPPEVAIANSQTNEQADGKAQPAIHMPEDPALRMAGNTQPGGSINPMAPPPFPASSGQSSEPSEGPNYAQLADVARRARGQDSENINRWNLGEGLKEAFAIARGQHYSGRPYGGTLEEPAVEKEQANTQKRIQDYLTRKRQGEIDTRQGKLVESEIGKNNAEAEKARAGKASGPDSRGAYIAMLKATHPEYLKAHGVTDDVMTGMDAKGLADLQNAAEAETGRAENASQQDKTRATTIDAARIAANTQRSFQTELHNQGQSEKLAQQLSQQKIPETLATIGELEKEIAKYGKEGIPGVGPVAGRTLPFDIDTFFRSPEGAQNLNRVQQLQEAHRVAVTGAGAGPTELAMLNRTIMSPTDRPELLPVKLQTFKDLVQARRRGIEAGYTGEQLDRYIGQLSEVKQREAPVLPRKTVGGKTYEKRPDGWHEVGGG